ncbi:MAG: DUF1273 family protein [Oscillospiraceae bacterium]|nr:DUF1273 family protein [Oscillospiraceae bacterium]
MKNKSVCFSGHRPHKLPDNKAIINVLKSRLYMAIIDSVKKGYCEFYTGCALGVDIWAAMFLIEMKKSDPKLKVHCVIPYQGHSKKWSAYDKYNLECVLRNADSVCCLSERYYRGCFAVRNKYIVDRSSLLIAVIDDESSGTGQTVRYAEKNGIEIIRLDVTDADETEYVFAQLNIIH